jgi:hypothetical protein
LRKRQGTAAQPEQNCRCESESILERHLAPTFSGIRCCPRLSPVASSISNKSMYRLYNCNWFLRDSSGEDALRQERTRTIELTISAQSAI